MSEERMIRLSREIKPEKLANIFFEYFKMDAYFRVEEFCGRKLLEPSHLIVSKSNNIDVCFTHEGNSTKGLGDSWITFYEDPGKSYALKWPVLILEKNSENEFYTGKLSAGIKQETLKELYDMGLL